MGKPLSAEHRRKISESLKRKGAVIKGVFTPRSTKLKQLGKDALVGIGASTAAAVGVDKAIRVGGQKIVNNLAKKAAAQRDGAKMIRAINFAQRTVPKAAMAAGIGTSLISSAIIANKQKKKRGY